MRAEINKKYVFTFCLDLSFFSNGMRESDGKENFLFRSDLFEDLFV